MAGPRKALYGWKPPAAPPLRRLDLQQPDGRQLVLLLERHHVEHSEPPAAPDEDLLARLDHRDVYRCKARSTWRYFPRRSDSIQASGDVIALSPSVPDP